MAKSKKKIIAIIKLNVSARNANPSPPIGPALGQRGLNIMQFCKEFNALTTAQNIEAGTPIPVEISAYEDKTFTFITKTPPTTYFLKKYALVNKGSKAPKKDPNIGEIKMSQCREIAKIKMADLNSFDVEAGARIIRGSAESMGLKIIED